MTSKYANTKGLLKMNLETPEASNLHSAWYDALKHGQVTIEFPNKKELMRYKLSLYKFRAAYNVQAAELDKTSANAKAFRELELHVQNDTTLIVRKIGTITAFEKYNILSYKKGIEKDETNE